MVKVAAWPLCSFVHGVFEHMFRYATIGIIVTCMWNLNASTTCFNALSITSAWHYILCATYEMFL